MLDRYEKNKNPCFKEVASFVKVTQDYVNFVEEFLFSQLDEQRYLRELVWNGLSEELWPAKIDREAASIMRTKFGGKVRSTRDKR